MKISPLLVFLFAVLVPHAVISSSTQENHREQEEQNLEKTQVDTTKVWNPNYSQEALVDLNLITQRHVYLDVLSLENSDNSFSSHRITPLKKLIAANTKKRQLSNDECMTFAFSQDNSNGVYQDDYVDVNGSGTTLQQYCDSHGCCNQNGYYSFYQEYYDDQACGNWSTNSNVRYTLCPNSCVGLYACSNLGLSAGDGSTFHLSKDSCSDNYSCENMAYENTNKLKLVIGEGSCSNERSCKIMAYRATNLQELSVGKQACTELSSCEGAAYGAETTSLRLLTQIIVNDGECNSSEGCKYCGFDSTFDKALRLTEECCVAVSGEASGNRFDEACNYIPPPPEVKPCDGISCGNAGKCSLSPTDSSKPWCTCENTFEMTYDNKGNPSCTCGEGKLFNANANRCFDITESPSKSPTLSPSLAASVAPSQETKDEDEENACEDDETATFELINRPNEWRLCSWIMKNNKKRDVRKARYCVLDYIQEICPATCEIC